MGLIYEALNKAMASVGAIEKNRKNDQQHYKFRSIDDIYSAVQPVFIESGIVPLPKVLNSNRYEVQTKSGGVLNYTVLDVQYTFYAMDGSSVEATVVGEAMDSGDKSSNKAMSAAYKYALLQILCIPTEDADNDADAYSHNNLAAGKVQRDQAKPRGTTAKKNVVEGPEPEEQGKPVAQTAVKSGLEPSANTAANGTTEASEPSPPVTTSTRRGARDAKPQAEPTPKLTDEEANDLLQKEFDKMPKKADEATAAPPGEAESRNLMAFAKRMGFERAEALKALAEAGLTAENKAQVFTWSWMEDRLIFFCDNRLV